MGEGITPLGQRNPRKGLGSDKLDPLLASFPKALEHDDDPASRACPANITILRGLVDALDVAKEARAVGQLCIHSGSQAVESAHNLS